MFKPKSLLNKIFQIFLYNIDTKWANKIYLEIKYKNNFGYKLNLDNPQTFNEKIQWLKLNDKRPIYTTMVDKYAVKKYVSEIIGEQYIIPTLGIWDKFDDINFDELPNQFVLKCTHDSGGVIIVKDKETLDIKKAKRKIERSLNTNYYLIGREWPYKNVKPRIIAEKYLEEKSGQLNDYKIFNFDGEPKLIQVDYDRFTHHRRNLYDTSWKYIEASIGYSTDRNHIIYRPNVLDEMLILAKKLSKGYPHIRTDFYCISNHIYFGELTLYHGSGLEIFSPEEFNLVMGHWLKLPSVKN